MPAINLENSTMSVVPVSRRGIMMNAIICYMDKEQIYNALLEMRKALTSAEWAEMMMRVCADLDAKDDGEWLERLSTPHDHE